MIFIPHQPIASFQMKMSVLSHQPGIQRFDRTIQKKILQIHISALKVFRSIISLL